MYHKAELSTIDPNDQKIIKNIIIKILLDKKWVQNINYNGVINEDIMVDIMSYIEDNNDTIQQYENQYEIFSMDNFIRTILYENQQFIKDTLNETINNNNLLSFNKTYLNIDGTLNDKGLELKNTLIEGIKDFIEYDLINYIDINNTSIDDIVVIICDEYTPDVLIDLFFMDTNKFTLSLKAEIQAFANEIINDYVINNYSKIIVSLHKNDKNKQYIYGQLLIEYLYKNLDNLLPRIKFKQENNGTYHFSWLDMGKGSRDDANAVFEFIKKDNTFKQSFLTTNNISEKQLKIIWPSFVDFVQTKLYNEELQLKVRQYIVNLNDDILNQRSEKLINSGTETGAEYEIDFSPENDHERSKPIIVAKEFLDDGTTKNHVFFGEKGWNHGSVIRKYSNFLNTKCLNELNSPVISCAYLVGEVAFADPDRMYNGFDTIEEVINTLKQDPHIKKVYNLPPKPTGGNVTRLAKKCL